MDVLDAIQQRRTIKRFTAAAPPRELIEQVLDAAVWAPNHHMTEPWRFVVVTGDALQTVARLRGEAVAGTLTGVPAEVRAARIAEARQKALAAPVSVVVAVHQDADPVRREEDFAAAAAAVQNILLAATGLGLAAYWGTGILASHAPFREFLGLGADDKIVGIVQVGYGVQDRTQRRTPARERTRWLN